MDSKLSLLVLGVALLALGVAGYALTQAPPAPAAVTGPDSDASVDDALNRLENRLVALEAVVLRRREELDPRILEQLDDLDRRLKALADARGASAAGPAATIAPEKKDGGTAAAGEPDAEDVEKFEKLRAAAARQEKLRRNQARVGKVLTQLRISLTDRQRDQLVEAWSGFEPRRMEIWGEAKRGGAAAGPSVDWGVIIADTNRTIEREFAERIAPFISGGDAERIAAGLNTDGK
jgi:hypothetical protein